MLPRRPEFDVSPANTASYETRVDLNGNRLEDVGQLIREHKRTIYKVPGVNGGSGKPWVVVSTANNEFRFGFKTTLAVPPDQELINRLDSSIPLEVPKNIPFILENIGVPEAQAIKVHEVVPTSEIPRPEAEQRELRRYYVIS